MNEIVLAIIVVVVLLVILASLFLFTVKRVNILVKKIFVDKLQEYDFLIDDKEKKIEELNGNIEIKKNEEKELEDLINKLKTESENFEILLCADAPYCNTCVVSVTSILLLKSSIAFCSSFVKAS